MKPSWKQILVAITLAVGSMLYLGGCGSGVEFGAKTFVLTGAGS